MALIEFAMNQQVNCVMAAVMTVALNSILILYVHNLYEVEISNNAFHVEAIDDNITFAKFSSFGDIVLF